MTPPDPRALVAQATTRLEQFDLNGAGAEAYDMSMICELRDALTSALNRVDGAARERSDTITALRGMCAEHGDNEWSDNLHLADVVDKHLHRHLAYAPLADDARARAIEERLGRVIPGPWSSASDDACPAVTSHGRIIAQCTNYTVAALIAHAPDDLAYLLGRVRALTAEVAAERSKADEWRSRLYRAVPSEEAL